MAFKIDHCIHSRIGLDCICRGWIQEFEKGGGVQPWFTRLAGGLGVLPQEILDTLGVWRRILVQYYTEKVLVCFKREIKHSVGR